MTDSKPDTNIESDYHQDGPLNESKVEQSVDGSKDSIRKITTKLLGRKYKKTQIQKYKQKKKFKKIISTIFSIFLWSMSFLLVFVCMSNLYQQLFNPTGYAGFFGIGGAVVASDSMKPDLSPNDLIFYRQATADDIDVGDVVVYKKTHFYNPDTLIIHKVIEIQDDHIIAKGINNAVDDDPVHKSAIVGKYLFKINGMGFLIGLMSTLWAPIIMIAIIVLGTSIRISFYYTKRKNAIAQISHDKQTQNAIDTFFDV